MLVFFLIHVVFCSLGGPPPPGWLRARLRWVSQAYTRAATLVAPMLSTDNTPEGTSGL